MLGVVGVLPNAKREVEKDAIEKRPCKELQSAL